MDCHGYFGLGLVELKHQSGGRGAGEGGGGKGGVEGKGGFDRIEV